MHNKHTSSVVIKLIHFKFNFFFKSLQVVFYLIQINFSPSEQLTIVVRQWIRILIIFRGIFRLIWRWLLTFLFRLLPSSFGPPFIFALRCMVGLCFHTKIGIRCHNQCGFMLDWLEFRLWTTFFGTTLAPKCLTCDMFIRCFEILILCSAVVCYIWSTSVATSIRQIMNFPLII